LRSPSVGPSAGFTLWTATRRRPRRKSKIIAEPGIALDAGGGAMLTES
jgi:hypothetical protein